MVITETRIKAGYEDIHNAAKLKLDGLDETIANELAEAKVSIEEKFAKDKDSLMSIIADCTEIVEVEVPDKVVESVEGENQETLVTENATL